MGPRRHSASCSLNAPRCSRSYRRKRTRIRRLAVADRRLTANAGRGLTCPVRTVKAVDAAQSSGAEHGFLGNSGRPSRHHPKTYRHCTRKRSSRADRHRCCYHVAIHREAAHSSSPRTGLAVVSDLLMLGALLMQIDFGSYNCGHTSIDGVLWTFGWSSEYRCTLIRGVPAVLLDVAFYVPAAVTWWILRAHSREMRRHPRS
jgi:hypothetical protein